MTVLAEVYASAPAGEIIIPSLEIRIAGKDPIRLCTGFRDQLLGVDGVFRLFEAGALSLTLPAKDTRGMQTLNFGIPGMNGRVQKEFDDALESRQPVEIIYREYLSSNKSAPARRPYVMDLIGGTLEGGDAQLSAGFFDVLNRRWPREVYTSENAPGIKYL